MIRGQSFKNYIAIAIDIGSVALAFLIGMWLRLGDNILNYPLQSLVAQTIIFTGVATLANIFFNIYRGVWRYFNYIYLLDIIKSASIAILLFLLATFIVHRLQDLPRSVIVIDWFLLITFISLPRALYRIYHDKSLRYIFSASDTTRSPIIIVGLGSSTEFFISELNRLNNASYKVVGIIDTKQNIGRRVYNIPILGDLEDIEKVVNKLTKKKNRPTRLLVSSEFYLGGKLQKLLKIADKLSIPVSRIPKVTELHHNPTGNIPMQPIPLEDLLRRSQRVLDKDSIQSMIKGKNVLITGAGGSIGSEIVRQVIEFGPAKICLMDNSEFLLYEIEQECCYKFPHIKKQVTLGDIRNQQVVDKIFSAFKPDIVFHAAALKHVPLLEAHKIEAIETNIFGTKNIIDAALTANVERFVMISTDKAVDPSSFMGATKKFAELYCQAQTPKKTKISIVRFGNVLGSNGSVVPLFEKQIAGGGPVTVTHADATRFFMTIREAVGLVLQASAFKRNDNNARVYVLDMGKPVKILDLATHMIMLAGLKPNIDIKINIIGLRPGEKLHEILVTEHEALSSTECSEIFLANPKSQNQRTITQALNKLVKTCINRDDKLAQKVINAMVKSK